MNKGLELYQLRQTYIRLRTNLPGVDLVQDLFNLGQLSLVQTWD